MNTKTQELSVRDAAFHTVHDYPGGCTPLAARMGINPQTLAHKVNPKDQNRYALNLEESLRVQALSGDCRILHAMARELGFVALQLDPLDDESVNNCITAAVQEFGELLRTVGESLSDQKVTDRELSQIDAALGNVMNRANALRARLGEMNDQLHPSGSVIDLRGR